MKSWLGKLGLLSALVALMTALLCGCGNQKAGTLWEDSVAEVSHLEVSFWDGESGAVYYMDDGMQEEIAKKISKVSVKEAEDWSHEELTFPVYGMAINDMEGNEFELAWSNGYGITADGTVYSFDYDFGEVIADYEWSARYDYDTPLILPCAKALSTGEDAWITEMLMPAEEPVLPEGISMVLMKQEKDSLTVEITNHKTEDWCYGMHFGIQALVDGVWYNLPTIPGLGYEYMIEIAAILPAGETRKEVFKLEMYGALLPGTYRLVKEGMKVEFEIENF